MKDSKKASVKQILTNYLEQNNRRKTPERYAILDAVYDFAGQFSLDELEDRLCSNYHFLVSRATLYNTLRLFVELRLVVRHRFQGAARYETCYDKVGHSHQICTQCGTVTEIRAAEINEAVDSIHLRRFRKDGFALYIYGICSACQAKRTRSKGIKTKNNKT